MSIQINVTENNVNLRWEDRKLNFSPSSDLNQFFKILRNLQRTARDEIATIVVCWMRVILHGASSLLALFLTRFPPFLPIAIFAKRDEKGWV